MKKEAFGMGIIEERMQKTESKMKKSIEVFGDDLKTIRAGRANPAVLDKVTVDYYGTPTQINQMAAVSVPEARLMVIQPWDISTLSAIQKAILASDLGLNPASDGKVLRITFPPLTEERRRDLVKDVSKHAEECKVAVRTVRRDANEKLKAAKKNTEITEDDLKSAEEKIQKLTDKYVKVVDDMVKEKEKEIMEI
jgi:ribosome recycling factor